MRYARRDEDRGERWPAGKARSSLKSLVIGGNGFIGGHLVGGLLDAGDPVRVYDRSPNKFGLAFEGAEYMEGELGNHGLIREAVEGMEVVFHLVSTTLPKTSNDDPIYDVRSNLVDTLQLLEACVEAGIPRQRLIADPGIGFGKTLTHNLEILQQITLFHGLGVALMIGLSRKSFMSKLTGEKDASQRVMGSLGGAIHAALNGVHAIRVHDVEATRQALAVVRAMVDQEFSGPTASA